MQPLIPRGSKSTDTRQKMCVVVYQHAGAAVGVYKQTDVQNMIWITVVYDQWW